MLTALVVRSPWAARVGAAVPFGFGLWAAVVRNVSVGGAIRTVPDRAVIGTVAATHAGADRILWVAATVAASVLAVDALAAAVRSERQREVASAGAAGAWRTPLFALLMWFLAPLIPRLVVVTGPIVLAAIALRRCDSDRVVGNAAGALSFSGFAALAASDAALFELLQLAHPSDAGRVDLAAVARAGTVLLALGAAGHAARLYPRRSLAVLAVSLLAALGVERWAAAAALRYGPPAELAAVRAGLIPARPLRIGRPNGGCLMRPAPSGGWTGTTVGWPRSRAGTVACPEPVGPGAFAPDAAPLLAPDAAAPVADLLGWHRGGVGEVVVLVRVGGGFAMPAWRVATQRVEVWETTGDPRGRPMLGSVLLYRGADGALLASSDGTTRTEAPAADARRALEGRVRADLLIHRSLVQTAAELLSICREVAPDDAAGIRCVLVDGAPDAWVGTLP